MIALRFDQRLVRPKKYIGEIAMPSPAAELNNRLSIPRRASIMADRKP